MQSKPVSHTFHAFLLMLFLPEASASAGKLQVKATVYPTPWMTPGSCNPSHGQGSLTAMGISNPHNQSCHQEMASCMCRRAMSHTVTSWDHQCNQAVYKAHQQCTSRHGPHMDLGRPYPGALTLTSTSPVLGGQIRRCDSMWGSAPAGVVVHVALDVALGLADAAVDVLLVAAARVARYLRPRVRHPRCSPTQPAERLHMPWALFQGI